MHTVSGDVLVSRSVLPEGEAGVDATVLRMAQLAHSEWGSKSPKIRALAMNIVQRARVNEKDYYGEIVAIHDWIKNPNNIRYFRDPVGQETLADPEQTAFNLKGGDCLAGHTRLAASDGLKYISDIKVGDVVQGKNGWAKVTQWWDKGVLPTKRYLISSGPNDGSYVHATDDHKWILGDGTEKLSKELMIGDVLLTSPVSTKKRTHHPKLLKIEDSGNQHVYDIETSDHGIYLPDADIVVHNCDDKTVLEMALLGSIGIPTYPVVVGQQKGSFCHVYLHAVVPPGKHRMANRTVPLDPIMRYWAAGVEAKNVKAKKTYPQFANPLGLQGNNMSGLGAYAVGPSYLDQNESHASKLLVPDKRDCYTYEDGSVANATRATQRMEGIDSLMGLGAMPPTGGYFTETSAGGQGTIATSDGQLVPRGFMRTEPSTAEIMDMHPATPAELGPRGPIFARKAKEETNLMPRIHAETIPTLSRRLAAGGLPVASTPQTVGLKRYDVPGVQRALEQHNLTGRPYRNQFLRGQKTVSVQPMNIERLGKEAKPVSLGEELADYEYTHTQVCGMLGAWAQKMNRGPMPLAQRDNVAQQIRALIQERDSLERRILEIKQKLRGMQPQKLNNNTVRSNAVMAQIPSASFEQNDLMLRPSGGISTTVSGMGGFADVVKSPFVYAPAALLVGIALFKLLRPKRR